MCMYMYIYIYVCVNADMPMKASHLYACIHTYIHTYIHTSVYVECIYVHYICIYKQTNVKDLCASGIVNNVCFSGHKDSHYS